MALLCAGISFDLVYIYQRTRLVYFYILRVNFYLKTWTWGLRDQVRLPWQPYICQSKYARFCSSPKVTYLHTKNEGVLKIFISKFASLSQRSALKTLEIGWMFSYFSCYKSQALSFVILTEQLTLFILHGTE